AEEVAFLDAFPATVRRPLCLIEGHAYAAAWVPVQVTVHRGAGEDGAPVYYDPPVAKTETVLVVIRNDGAAFCASAAPGCRPLQDLGVSVALPNTPSAERLWSGAGVKRFLAGERARPADVFGRVVAVVGRFMDFCRSLAGQETMCEFVACYSLSTWL